MIRRRLMRVAFWSLAALVLLAAAGFLWLRQSPYWAGITLFSESHRVEYFRDMGRVFPARAVPRGETVCTFDHAPQPLPETYTFGGPDRSLAAFLDRTQTTGLLVVHRGAITREEYRLGADETSPLTSWSVAQPVLSTLLGIAVEEGHIASIRDPIGPYVPALAGSGYGPVPIEDALTMSSGMAFDEDYDSPFSDINMLVWRAMAMGQPVEVMLAGLGRLRDPGTCNDYISSDSMAPGLVLGLVVLEAATGAPVAEDLASRLWGPTAAEADASWSTDRTGRECAPCFLNATLRDNARFGRLFLDGGVRDGRQIVPADWLHASVNPTDAQLQSGQNPASNRTFGYGYQWWIPKEPQGDFAAIGVWGQSAPAAAGPKTMRFAHASPLVAGKGMIP